MHAPPILCACGCGQVPKMIGSTFVRGHQSRAPAAELRRRSCACGCGRPVANPRARYTLGHAQKAGRAGLSEVDRFWRLVDRAGPDDCWWWRGGHTGGGYGVFGVGSRTTGDARKVYAHRYSLELSSGPFEAGMQACHTCDVRHPPGDTTYRGCVNPAHLFRAPGIVNSRDAAAKGRVQRGERGAMARLSEHQVREIRRRRADGAPLDILAREHGVSSSTVSAIARRKRWAHLDS